MSTHFRSKTLAFVLTAIVLLSLSKTSHAQWRHNSISADSLLILFSQMTPFEVFDYVPWGSIDRDDCFDNMEVRQHIVKWLDKDLYFQHKIQKSLNIAFSDEEVRRNKVAGWLIRSKKRELIDTILNTQELYAAYLDTVINNYIHYHRNDFFKHGAKLPDDVLSFFTGFRVPEAHEVLYRHWQEDGKRRQSPYYGPLIAMLNPDALAIANHEIDSIIATNDPQGLLFVYRRYARRLLFCQHSVDWLLKLLETTGRWNISEFDDSPQKMVPFNVYVLDPANYTYFPSARHFLDYSDNEFANSMINRLFEPWGRIYELSDKELEAISQEIIDNIHEFEKAAQPFKEMQIEDCRKWKEQMPHKK
jgi:hypothetical protein